MNAYYCTHCKLNFSENGISRCSNCKFNICFDCQVKLNIRGLSQDILFPYIEHYDADNNEYCLTFCTCKDVYFSSKTKVGMIAACDLNGVIGHDNNLPWTNREDLLRFQELTMDSTVIMGRKTYDSLPVNKKTGVKLAGRIKHVLSHQNGINTKDTMWFCDLNKALLACPSNRAIWIIGGESLYKLALNLYIPDFIDLTILNKITVTDTKKISSLPQIPYRYIVESEIQNKKDKILWHRHYIKRSGGFGSSYIQDLKKL